LLLIDLVCVIICSS